MQNKLPLNNMKELYLNLEWWALSGETRILKFIYAGAGAPPVSYPWCNRASGLPLLFKIPIQ